MRVAMRVALGTWEAIAPANDIGASSNFLVQGRELISPKLGT
jgi:hypothetical protein